MTRAKKSRKVNSNGPARPAREKKQEKIATKKRGKGQMAGNRHSSKAVQQGNPDAAAKDPRLGSKKPIALTVASAAPAKPKTLAPEKELAKLENDPRLHTLLERVEDGEVLAQHDQFWLDSSLARIAVLMDQLGIEDHDEDDAIESAPMPAPAAQSDEDALLDAFNQGEDLLDQFKD
ncbi:Der GTPase-activating protein YihI [Ferrimonas pelagia]|uniref:Der GTPase-activating protein YihI n=1 Tax=Ferrimonas pelagia TaxID=1177826 RepID=A0ABP9EGK8_9GAMM